MNFQVSNAGGNTMTQRSRPAPAKEIVEIVGPLDDAVLVRIVETEASPAEVLKAFTWGQPLTVSSAPSWSRLRAASWPGFMRSLKKKSRDRTREDNISLEDRLCRLRRRS
jgi:hypothetical protein